MPASVPCKYPQVHSSFLAVPLFKGAFALCHVSCSTLNKLPVVLQQQKSATRMGTRENQVRASTPTGLAGGQHLGPRWVIVQESGQRPLALRAAVPNRGQRVTALAPPEGAWPRFSAAPPTIPRKS